MASPSLLDVCFYLCQIFKTAANQRVGAAVGRHLHGVLDESEQLHRQVVEVEDVAEDHLHVLHTDTVLDGGFSKTLKLKICDAHFGTTKCQKQCKDYRMSARHVFPVYPTLSTMFLSVCSVRADAIYCCLAFSPS